MTAEKPKVEKPKAENAVKETSIKEVKQYNAIKMVTIEIPFGTTDNDEDMFVSVNNKRYLIRIGEKVDVPAPVAEVVNRHLEQRRKNILRNKAMQERFSKTGL